MAIEIKNPYSINLVRASKTKLYNPGILWAYNTAKYRALLSNDPVLIKHFYKQEQGIFLADSFQSTESKRSFYYGDDFDENAEEYFGLIPMVCESLAKMVCGSGYVMGDNIPDELAERLRTILDESSFDEDILKNSVIETIGIGDCAWHICFDAELSDHPIIEFIPAERLEIERKHKCIIKYIIKQLVILDDEEIPYELHTIYTKQRAANDVAGVKRYRDDGIKQEFKVWSNGAYIKQSDIIAKVFKAYDIEKSENILPLTDYPVIYLPNTLNRTCGVLTGNTRPYGIVFGLESNSSAIDETLSNCVDTIRKCFPFLLIDESMIPSDIEGNKDKTAFSTRRHNFVLPKNAAEPEKLLQMIQAKLNTTEYVEAVKFQINIALNKVGLNAATLGLCLTGQVEAEPTQNAKERNSIRTRNALAADYQKYLSRLFSVLLQYDDYVNGNTIATDNATGEQSTVVTEYGNLTPTFNKYIVDTPEEVSTVLAQKVQANLMSVFAAIREQHPEWDDEAIYKETNLIYAEKNLNMQVVNPEAPTEESIVIASGGQEGEQVDDGSDEEESAQEQQE